MAEPAILENIVIDDQKVLKQFGDFVQHDPNAGDIIEAARESLDSASHVATSSETKSNHRWFAKLWPPSIDPFHDFDSQPTEQAIKASERDAQKHAALESCTSFIYAYVVACIAVIFYTGWYVSCMLTLTTFDFPLVVWYLSVVYTVSLTVLMCSIRYCQLRSNYDRLDILLCVPLISFSLVCVLADVNSRNVLYATFPSLAHDLRIEPSKESLCEPNFDIANIVGLIGAGGFFIMFVTPASKIYHTTFVSWLLYALPTIGFRLPCQNSLKLVTNLPHLLGAFFMWYVYAVMRDRNFKLHVRLFAALAQQKKKWIDEKVLRCEMEFNASRQTNSLGKQHIATDSSQARQSEGNSTALSARTAPAALLATDLAETDQEQCLFNDCVPEDMLVQVQGYRDPQRIGSLRAGQSVLSWDSLTSKACFVEVLDVSINDAPHQWTSVTLADNTILSMTADHPVRVDEAKRFRGTVLAAADLQPEQHSLTCLRHVKIPVKAVSTSSKTADNETRRVAVVLKHGARFSLCVSSYSGQSPLNESIALGSADLQCGEWKQVNQTYDYVGPNRGAGVWMREAHVIRRCKSESSLELLALSVGSRDSRSEQDAKTTLPNPCATPHTAASVTSTLAVSTADASTCDEPLLSVGTMNHGNQCVPCKFQKQALGCLRGSLCRMCHHPDHDHLTYSMRNKFARKYAKRVMEDTYKATL